MTEHWASSTLYAMACKFISANAAALPPFEATEACAVQSDQCKLRYHNLNFEKSVKVHIVKDPTFKNMHTKNEFLQICRP